MEVPGKADPEVGEAEVASTVSLQPLGDPTVKRFLSRDMDSWILPRERAAVKQWEDNPGYIMF